ncbi:MAG: MarR family transcriptional regulator, partial [archaeon]|nr:MarR family transcriptional regulator [archaeon]
MSEIKSNSHIFEGRILEFERVLLDYYIGIADRNQQSKKVAVISAYLSIHGQLTQGQLKKLTKFSISTISTNLMNLINLGHIKRKMKPGTHEYIYFPTPTSADYIDQALGSLKPEINFFKMKINELEEMLDFNKKGYTLLLSRLKETLRTFQVYHEILDVIQNPNLSFNVEGKKEPETLEIQDLQFLEDEFDDDLKKIEVDILDFFMHQSAYSILKNFSLILFVYFITRKVLTQEKLRKLTGLSLGKVSQVLNTLLDV